MNDADLEKLLIKPGKLNPIFDRNTTSYEVVLESTTKEITIAPVTRDVNSSWTIVGYGNRRQIPLADGESHNVIIEVTAEDGTEKQYTLNVFVLSASDASLSNIILSHGSLYPTFHHDTLEYSVNVPWNLESVKILPEAKDKKTQGANEFLEVSLNYGETGKVIELLSPNKMACKSYLIKFVKGRILRLVTPVEYKEMLHCPICLGEVHCAVSLKQNAPQHSMKMYCCRSCVNMVTRTRKINPFTEAPLSADFISEERDIDEKLSNISVFCCYSDSGCEMKMELSNLGSHMDVCQYRPVLTSQYERIVPQNVSENQQKAQVAVCDSCSKPVFRDDLSAHTKLYCPAKKTVPTFEHVVRARDWEKNLLQKYNVDEVGTTCKNETSERGMISNDLHEDDATQLELAAARYAGMVKVNPRDALNHFLLGSVFEEMFYTQHICGIKKKDAEEGNDEKACEDSFDLEIKAICKARGVSENAELSQILKALDSEYRELLLENQSAKADYLQNLYAWKSKQSTKKRKSSFDGSNDIILERALMKFLDASSCDPNDATYHMHIGRLLLMQQKYEDAVTRLEVAFGLRPSSIEAKFYLGLAYAKLNTKNADPRHETVKFLQDGIDYILYMLFEGAPLQTQLPPFCSTKIFVRHSNVLLVEGMLELANCFREKGPSTEKETKTKIGMYQQTSKLCIQMLYGIKNKSDTCVQFQWIVVRAQFSIGMLKSQLASSTDEKEDARKYWERLAALIKAFELPVNDGFLKLQNDIWEEAAVLSPSNSEVLYHLGDSQLALYDNFTNVHNYSNDIKKNNMHYLEEAERSYRASIRVEGKSLHGNEHSSLISDSLWWKKRHRNSQGSTKLKSEVIPQLKCNEKVSKPIHKVSSVTNKGQMRASKPAQAKTSYTSTSKGGTVNAKNTKGISPKAGVRSSGVQSKASGTKQVKSTAARHTGCSTQSNKPMPKASKSDFSKVDVSNRVGATEKREIEAKKQPKTEEVKKNVSEENKDNDFVANSISYQARLGLARVLSRVEDAHHWFEIKELYQEVMKLAPDLHDAYIELGEMLAQKEPKQAIEIYKLYPFEKEGNFDDAYLHEEIIRLIIKTGDFENPCLQSSMIGYGKIMGFSALDKTVSILEDKSKFDVLMKVYAQVNGKDIQDEDLQTFFKFKYWA